MNRKMVSQSGQVALIVLLMAAVVLTVGISVASRSVSEVRVTEEEEGSTEAFNVAEGAIEDILSRDLDVDYPGVGEYSVPVNVGDKQASCTLKRSDSLVGVIVFPGHSVEYDTTGADSGGGSGLDIAYTGTPAFVVTVFDDSGGGIINRQVYDATGNIDDAQLISGGGGNFTVSGLTANSQFARIKVLYDRTTLNVSPQGSWINKAVQMDLPNCQAVDVDGANRAVELSRAASSLPSIFDYVLFSGNGALKQQP